MLTAPETVVRAQAGDMDAFGDLYAEHYDFIFGFISRRVPGRELAEDLTSDTFLRAMRRIGGFTWQGRDLGAWLVTIARNLVADYFKSGRYRFEVTSGDVPESGPTLVAGRDRWAEPEQAAAQADLAAVLDAALRSLTPEQRRVLALRYTAGMTMAAIADELGKDVGAVKALQWRACQSLARRMPDGYESRRVHR